MSIAAIGEPDGYRELIYKFQIPFHYIFNFTDGDTLLFHCITVTDRYSIVLFCLMVDGNAKRCTDRIHSPVTLPYSVFFFVKTFEEALAAIHDVFADFRKTVLFS